ncbi:MAG: dockerin type I domain-containing protein [Planctomycetota bacterium]
MSAGSFSTLNPTLPITNIQFVNQLLADVLVDATDVVPAGSWSIEIDTVDANLPPEFVSAGVALVPENQVSVLDLEAVDDDDAENAGLTYGISGGDDAALFTIDTVTGQLDFLTAPDVENPTDLDLDNLYEVTVDVTDSSMESDSLDVMITVEDVNEAPTADAGGPYTIDAGQDLVLDASSSSDPDSGDSLTFAWDLDQDGNDDIVTADPVTTVAWLTVVDLMQVGIQDVQLTVQDSGGLSSTALGNVTISDRFVFTPPSDGTADAYTLRIQATDIQVVNTADSTLLSRVPLAPISTIDIIGGDDNDELTIDFSGGEFGIPIDFDGGLPTAPNIGDSLVLAAGSATSVEHTFFTETSGSIAIGFSVGSETITYDGLEPIIDNLDATNRIFTFDGGAESIVLRDDDPMLDNNVQFIDSDLGESVTFTSPSDSLTINAGSGADAITIQALDPNAAFTTLEVNGGEGADEITLEALASMQIANLNGDAGNDVIAIGITSLDDLLGTVNVAGGVNELVPTTNESVLAKAVSVSQNLIDGDVVQFNDTANAIGETYTLTEMTFARAGLSGSFSYMDIETIQVSTGSNDDTVNITNTLDFARTEISTNSGRDEVNITTTGTESVLVVDSGFGNDTLAVSDTGAGSIPGTDDGSITRLIAGLGDDNLSVLGTGILSGLSIDTGQGSDLLNVFDTGADSVFAADLGSEDDIVNVRATGLGSSSDFFGGDGTDTFNVSSDAAGDRVTPNAPQSGVLDGILGDICIFGEDPTPSIGISESVTAKSTSITQAIDVGDELNISDEGSIAAGDYSIDPTSVTKVGLAGSITYGTIETLNIETGSEADAVAIVSTADRTQLSLDTFGGADDVTITTTGIESILRVDTGMGNDTVSIADTGDGENPGLDDGSITSIVTGEGNDDVAITSTGVQAGLAVDTAAGVDLVNLLDTGDQSVVAITLGSENDIANVRGTGLDSFADFFGGDGIDTFNISSDAAGDRVTPNAAMAGVLDDLLGDICIFGEAPTAAAGIIESVTAKSITITQSYDTGDELNISDEGTGSDSSYALDATTFARTGLSGSIVYETVETLNLETSSAADTISIASTAASVRTTITTGSGEDDITVTDTGVESQLLIDTGTESDVVEILDTGDGANPGVDDGSVTLIVTGAGDDDVTVSMTGVQSGLSVDTGDGIDVVTIIGTGQLSATRVELGLADDIANVRGSGQDSASDFFGGLGTDTFNVSSDAAGNRVSPNAPLSGTLDGLLGEICVFGEAPAPVAGILESVSAKSITVSQTYAVGDELNLSDESNAANASYNLDASVFERVGLSGTVAYETIETLNIETGTGNSTVDVAITAANVRTTLTTLDGEDNVTVTDTGVESIFIVDTGVDSDIVSVIDTGEGSNPGVDDGSITIIRTGDGNDDVTISAIGVLSGLEVETGDESDIVTLEATGELSAVRVDLGSGNDIANIRSTGVDSATDLFGGLGLDTFNVSSNAAGTRPQPNMPVSGNLDALLGEICVFGEDPVPMGTDTDSITAKSVTVSVDFSLGDQLNISDAASVANHIYSLDATTFMRDGLSGNITFETIELISATTGSGNDDFTISTTPDSIDVFVNLSGGMDTATVASTGIASRLLLETGQDDDSVLIQSTGLESLTRVFTDEGDDDVEVVSSGTESGLGIEMGGGVDLLNLFGNGMDGAIVASMGDDDDIVNVRGLASGSAADIAGDDGNDTFNVSSNASGNRVDPDDNPSGTLDMLLGDLCIRGGSEVPGSDDELVRGRETIGGEETVSPSVATGDTLNVSDEASVAMHSYTVESDGLQRVGVGEIEYELIESLNLEAGQGDSDVEVVATADATAFRLDTFAGADVVTVDNTGSNSISRIFTGDDEDEVIVASTGGASASVIDTGAANDQFSIRSVGDLAGVRALTQAGEDVITIEEEVGAPTRSGNAVLDLRAGDGEDQFNVNEVYLRTVVDLRGEANDDDFVLSTTSADASGNLVNLNHDPMGSEIVASTRQLFLDGGDNDLGANVVLDGVNVVSNDLAETESVNDVAAGDQVFLDISPSTEPVDLRYAITDNSQAVLATTTPANGGVREDVGNEVFETLGIENVQITGTQSDDFFTVSSDVAYGIGSTGQLVDFAGGDGDDQFEVIGTDQSDLITLGLIGGDIEPFQVSDVEELRVDGGLGNDEISVNTAARTALNGEDGDDDIIGGSGTDLLTGGPGIDRLFGGDGDDVILSDRTIGSTDNFQTDGEILSGGPEDSLSPGDVCIQLGLDQIVNCETIVDGGGIKGVLTWLRGVFVSAEEAEVALDDFDGLETPPQSLNAVTEPSQVPSVVPTNNQGGGNPRPTRLDVNQSGQVTSLDALQVINYLARMPLPNGEQGGFEVDLLKDVNGNGTVEPLDALIVINFLARSQQQPSGEGVDIWSDSVDDAFSDRSDDDEWLSDSTLF